MLLSQHAHLRGGLNPSNMLLSQYAHLRGGLNPSKQLSMLHFQHALLSDSVMDVIHLKFLPFWPSTMPVRKPDPETISSERRMGSRIPAKIAPGSLITN